MRETLVNARKEKGLTQEQVAASAKIDRSSYVHIERGRNPSFKVAARLSDVLEKPIEELFPEFFLREGELKQHTKTGTDA